MGEGLWVPQCKCNIKKKEIWEAKSQLWKKDRQGGRLGLGGLRVYSKAGG